MVQCDITEGCEGLFHKRGFHKREFFNGVPQVLNITSSLYDASKLFVKLTTTESTVIVGERSYMCTAL